MTTTEEDTAPAPPALPEALLQGSFALYPYQGGFLIAWRKKGEEQTRHMPIPAMILQTAASMSGRTVDEMIAELAGMA